MHEVDSGPQCSLISYVVPPGLSRNPTVGSADPLPCAFTSLETISARNYRNEDSSVKGGTTHRSSSSPTKTSESAGTHKELSTTISSAQPSIKQVVKPPINSSHTTVPESHQYRKSCLTKNFTTLAPARQTLKKKTVAFGKTVNVSQTIEGTSRTEKLAKLQNSMSRNKSLCEEPMGGTENKENELKDSGKKTEEQTLMDVLEEVKSSLNALKIRDEERAVELQSIRQMVIERGKEVDLLRGMFADYIGKECHASFESKEFSSSDGANIECADRTYERAGEKGANPSTQRTNQRRNSSPISDLAKEKCDSDLSDDVDITFDEFRRLLTTNPSLRQFISDIRAGENDQRIGYKDRHRVGMVAESRWRDSPRHTDRLMEAKLEREGKRDDLKQRGSRGAKYTEKVTVERSVRCSPEMTQYSVDTRRYLEDQILDDNYDAVESIYQPGESVSYYPERVRRHGYIEDSRDLNENMGIGRTYRDNSTASFEERRRQRRIRRTDLL